MMVSIPAVEAKQHFGQMLDTVQREPVTIEKHGRPVAVVMSQAEYEKIKLERLRARLAVGKAQADKGEFSTKSVKDIIREGKERHNEEI